MNLPEHWKHYGLPRPKREGNSKLTRLRQVTRAFPI